MPAATRSDCETIMLFDEVRSVLDPALIGEVPDMPKISVEEGMTMTCLTHKMMLASDVSGHATYFHQGMTAEIGKPEAVFGTPQHPEMQKFLLSAR